MKSKQALVIAGFVSFILLLGGALVLTADGDESIPPPPTLEARADSQPYGVFEGRVPCGNVCERIKVRLTLFRDPASNEPADYMLERIYVGRGDDRLTTRGRWRVLNGPKPYDGTAIRLDDSSPADFSTYLLLGDVMLFLKSDLHPLAGDASHSFTLSRTR